MKLESPDFKAKGKLPSKLTCDGKDAIPELIISDVPAGVKSLALIMDDPDAPRGTWDHWICWNIPADTKKIDSLIGVGGKNSWGKTGYGGPCPPSGTHRYFFKLFALDKILELSKGSTKELLLKAMEEHIVEKAELMGKYKRNQ